ncbi:bsmI [Methylophaga aminisulfidivorans MP]|uniref:BsmI n=1 Tax=Methylophaga aminisulfidivorans MP TaxID=1026882 RepID=F5SZQ8_9GAMM|nr:hypothetical protein [Methylophaga aminisulfidivorans]EGL54485.1 bsmI [Methylophaga aminisulfidivorans MP]
MFTDKSLRHPQINIHGDNIVECERILELILKSMGIDPKSINPPSESITCPRFDIEIGDKTLAVRFFPGFGRWDHNILDSVREMGGTLREAADVIVTAVESGEEIPILAVEFCGALPAGNQAWQRSGRAYSFGLAKIPYLYVSELGGYELDTERNRKAPRLPNPAVPFSYISFSLERETPVFPIFITAPGADDVSRDYYKDVFADDELLELIREIIFTGACDHVFEKLNLKVLSFVEKRAKSSKRNDSLTSCEWQKLYKRVQGKSGSIEYLAEDISMTWSKKASIDALTENAKAIMKIASKYGLGVTAKDLPICVIPSKSKNGFAQEVLELIPQVSDCFKHWLKSKENLVICWVMGFKPGGDDARPDRGLPPFARMLVGEAATLMTIVYGPAPASTWPKFISDPAGLAKQNGLWEAILETSDAVLVESYTDNVTEKGYLRSHWEAELETPVFNSFLVTPEPLRLGENDVDTSIHLSLTKFCSGKVFEGMCNPPGGDWSGVSILCPDSNSEYRWISLPRVSAVGGKRPDHVFEFFLEGERPIILSIESKETYRSVEKNIGPRLNQYLIDLLRGSASIERAHNDSVWKHSEHSLNLDHYTLASGVAFKMTHMDKLKEVYSKAGADLIMAIDFDDIGKVCKLWLYTENELGEALSDYISVNVESDLISIERINN